MAIRKTSSVKGEENPWQVLADAIIIQAVKDYRNRARMMKRIRGCLKRNKEMTPSELACQAHFLLFQMVFGSVGFGWIRSAG